jgi:hypothetical protein
VLENVVRTIHTIQFPPGLSHSPYQIVAGHYCV